jgi:transposase-like protein
MSDRTQTFTREFRAEAVRLAQKRGRPAGRSPPISS